MATQEKIELVNSYVDKFKSAKSVYLADFTGIDVPTVTEVRKKFRDENIEYKVLKNRLAKRSLDGAKINDLDEYLKGVNAFVLSYDDPVAPARIIKEFNKKKEILKLKVVYLEGQVFTAERAAALADLPTREELLAKFVGLLQAPMSKLLGTLQAPMQKIAGTLDALKNSK
ncbi:MAG: 50S ribosomal protein L10 [Calditrichaceae bacterium]|jgi:large subunit ribosomal protein L10